MTLPLLSLVGALYLEVGRPKDALAVLKPLADPEDSQPAVLYNAGRAAVMAGRTWTRGGSTSPARCSSSPIRRRRASSAC